MALLGVEEKVRRFDPEAVVEDFTSWCRRVGGEVSEESAGGMRVVKCRLPRRMPVSAELVYGLREREIKIGAKGEILRLTAPKNEVFTVLDAAEASVKAMSLLTDCVETKSDAETITLYVHGMYLGLKIE